MKSPGKQTIKHKIVLFPAAVELQALVPTGLQVLGALGTAGDGNLQTTAEALVAAVPAQLVNLFDTPYSEAHYAWSVSR